MIRSIISISIFALALAAVASLVPTSSAFWLKDCPRSSIDSHLLTSRKSDSDDSNAGQQDLPPRQETTIRSSQSGKEITLISRTLPVFPNASVTVWELKNSAKVVNAFWEAQGDVIATPQRRMLDPFGLVTWPGSVLAARELLEHAEIAVRNRRVVVLGAGVGVETQAAAMLNPKSVIATDIHPTTLQQLELGVSRNTRIPSTTTYLNSAP